MEIHPSYRQDRHFRHAARMTGKIYMPVRPSVRETCSGSSDSVTVPVDELTRTVDGAVRIARLVLSIMHAVSWVCMFVLYYDYSDNYYVCMLMRTIVSIWNRNFGRGLAECGLQCPGSILALDASLNNYYKNGERKAAPINTRFPC